VTDRGFTLNVWANVNLTTQAEQGGIDSSSVSLAYEKEYAGFRFTPMVEYWGDRRIAGISDPASGEFSINISHPAGPVGLFLLQTVDPFKFRGATYTETGLTKSFTWRKVTIDATAARGVGQQDVFRGLWISARRGATGCRRGSQQQHSGRQRLLPSTARGLDVPAGGKGAGGVPAGVAGRCGDCAWV
jgi:hypothetical protein